MTTVYITEKPSAAKNLKPHVTGAKVVSCIGHLLTPKTPDEINEHWKAWSLAHLPILPETIGLKPTDAGTQQLKIIKNALKDASLVVIATDSGREGSLIGWEVLEHLQYKGKVARLHLEDLSDGGINSALEKMQNSPDSGEKDYSAYLEAKIRQEEDWLVGMNGSRAMTLAWQPLGARSVLSYGGVQMPTLSLLAMRENAIQNFVSTPYYVVTLDVALQHATVTFAHNLDSSKHRIEQKAIAEAVKERAMEWHGTVAVKNQDKAIRPPKFFSGNTLAKKCASLFGWRPNETEKILQGLYDNGYATYPRTESSLLPHEHITKAVAVLEAIEKAKPDLKSYIPSHANCRKNSHYVAHTGEHHAIVPTDKAPDFSSLQEQQQQLYTLLAEHFVAAHMEDALECHVSLTLDIDYNLFDNSKQEFSAKGKTTLQKGWKALLRGNETETEVPKVKDGEQGKALSAKVLDKKTEPPRRISLGSLPETMARLIDLVSNPEQKKALENPANPKEPKGLGTISSRKQVIETLLKRGYCNEKKGSGKDPLIEVTPLGLALWQRLKEIYPEHASPIARAIFEGNIAEIGKLEKTSAIKAYETSRQRTREQVTHMVHAITGNPRLLDASLWTAQEKKPYPSKAKKKKKRS